MHQSLSSVFNASLSRIPQMLDLETNYSHDNFVQWLEDAVNFNTEEKWEICFPKYSIESSDTPALSEWPSEELRPDIIKWLKENNFIGDENDFLDGLCEPLAIYFSRFILSWIKGSENKVELNLNVLMKSALEDLMKENTVKAADIVLKNSVEERSSPIVWGLDIVGGYFDYLFGNEDTKQRIKKNIKSSSGVEIMPVYLLNYIFDETSLDEESLKLVTLETAQYSCHVVGLVFDKKFHRIIIADANGPVKPGSNYEFINMPMKKRRAAASTNVSRYDLDCKNSKSKKRKFIK